MRGLGAARRLPKPRCHPQAIAKNFPSQKSNEGAILDPLADKVLMGASFGALAYTGLIAAPLAALCVTRDVALVGGTALKMRQFGGAAVTEVKASQLSRVNTVLQSAAVGGYGLFRVPRWNRD